MDVQLLVALVFSAASFQLGRTKTTSEIYGEEMLQESLYFRSGPYGSQFNGQRFTDFRQSLDGKSWQPKHWPDTINIRAGRRIDGLQMFYGTYRGDVHGSDDGGRLNRLRLYQGDRIVRVTGIAGRGPGGGVEQLTFFTRNGLVHGPYGATEASRMGRRFEARPPVLETTSLQKEACYLGWISGRADRRLDSIVFHWRCPKALLVVAGGEGLPGSNFYKLEDQKSASNRAFRAGEFVAFVTFMIVELGVRTLGPLHRL